MIKRQKILITGCVQGVGFRPAVYRLAKGLALTGFVNNDTKGVVIELQGGQEKITEFLQLLQSRPGKPPLAEIKSCTAVDIAIVEGENGFTIIASDSAGTTLSQVTADIATCADCLAEMSNPHDFRYRYPFINCTNCGARYSIVKSIPYDRANTTMAAFGMCNKCEGQYEDIFDRRFHAQPIACAACGPRVWLADNKGKILNVGGAGLADNKGKKLNVNESGLGEPDRTKKVIERAAELLLEGKIVAIKGVGGFHLAVNALDDGAVKKLRQRKKREPKPFAMMAESVEIIKKYALVDKTAEKILTSPQSPIVLLPKRKFSVIASSVAEGVETFGFMLCYAPLQYLLFAESGIEVLVMTSGNISEEPLICKNDEAVEKLSNVADYFLMHDREIYRQVDDSVVHIIDDKEVLLRRARGYVPTPILTRHNCRDDIFAAGGDMKNTFCFVKNNQLICSEHIGELENAEVYRHYIDSVEHLRKLFEIEPRVVACDLHPGYLSRQYALSLPSAKVIEIQHHWGHIGSVLAEYNIDGPVIGIECDGTGYGTDGAIWGCECMIASLTEFKRFGHLAYYQLAGADKASVEAVRPVLGLLMKAYGDDFRLSKFSWLLEKIESDSQKLEVIAEQLKRKVNTVESSSLGRVFDAVAAMAGLGSFNDFEAQLPIKLESIAAMGTQQCYEFELVRGEDGMVLLDLCRMIEQLVGDVRGKLGVDVISAKFHNTIAAGLLQMAVRARQETRLNTVALSGGVFCNRYLTNRLIDLLKKDGFEVLFNRLVPSNDGGLSLGQAAIAAAIV